MRPNRTPTGLVPLVPLLFSLASAPAALGRTIKVVNNCPTTLWPAIFTGGENPNPPQQATGWELESLVSTQFQVSDDWTAGRIWARTGCTLDEGGNFKCLTGGCGPGTGGDVLCDPRVTGEPPATLAEFTLAKYVDHYDISLVDGFNVPMNIYPTLPSCFPPSCPTNINPLCPPLLRTSIDAEGKNLGCLAACNAGFGQEKFGNRACCSGEYSKKPELCASCGVDYYSLFKESCNSSYAYAYDEKSGNALHTCTPDASGKLADYIVEFCPGQSDYVGTLTADPKFIDATATCSNKVTSGEQEFPVNPSPTKIATAGTLQVVATVLPGVDGAAALQIDGEQPNTSGGAASASTTSSASGSESASGASLGGDWLIYGSYSPSLTSSSTASSTVSVTSQTEEAAGPAQTPPINAAVVDNGGDGQCQTGGQHRNGRAGGQYLTTEAPQQRKRRRGMRYAKMH